MIRIWYLITSEFLFYQQYLKIYENIVSYQLIAYLVKFNLIDETQHRSRPNKSLVIAAASFIESVDKDQITLSVIVDLSKAFDRVKH